MHLDQAQNNHILLVDPGRQGVDNAELIQVCLPYSIPLANSGPHTTAPAAPRIECLCEIWSHLAPDRRSQIDHLRSGSSLPAQYLPATSFLRKTAEHVLARRGSLPCSNGREGFVFMLSSSDELHIVRAGSERIADLEPLWRALQAQCFFHSFSSKVQRWGSNVTVERLKSSGGCMPVLSCHLLLRVFFENLCFSNFV